ncbi:hypothetical protein HBB16_05810 [Pseudonocardia sp. MCCB 268]|nr:hypothetical protein [Pseudonocardia cytotoxica]
MVLRLVRHRYVCGGLVDGLPGFHRPVLLVGGPVRGRHVFTVLALALTEGPGRCSASAGRLEPESPGRCCRAWRTTAAGGLAERVLRGQPSPVRCRSSAPHRRIPGAPFGSEPR